MDKKLFSLSCLFLLIFVIPSIFSLNIAREFSISNINAGKNIDVKLIVTPSAGDEVYVIREAIPESIIVVNSGDGSFNNGKMLWVVMDKIKAVNHSYTIQGTKNGSYNFEGKYSLNGKNEVIISGQNNLVITGESKQNLGNNQVPPGGGGNRGLTSSNNNNLTKNQNENPNNNTIDSSTNLSVLNNILNYGKTRKTSKLVFWSIATIVIILIAIIFYFILKLKRASSSSNKSNKPNKK